MEPMLLVVRRTHPDHPYPLHVPEALLAGMIAVTMARCVATMIAVLVNAMVKNCVVQPDVCCAMDRHVAAKTKSVLAVDV